jgi:hypothetical protein
MVSAPRVEVLHFGGADYYLTVDVHRNAVSFARKRYPPFWLSSRLGLLRQMFGLTASVVLAVVGLLVFHVEPAKYAKPVDYRTDVLRSWAHPIHRKTLDLEGI